MVESMSDGDIALYTDFDNRFQRRDRKFGISRTAVRQLPFIDISPFVQDGSPAERQRVARELRDACINVGFFYLTGHGIPQSELDEVVHWANRFFELPPEEKMKVHKDLNPSRLMGYMQIGGTDPETNPDKAADLKENFNMAREPEPDEPEDGRFYSGQTLWPEPHVLPGFEDFMKSHIRKRVTLARQFVRALAMSLDLPETYFDPMFKYLGSTLLLNYYPALDPTKLKQTQWSNSPHSDYGSFTILSQDALGGLQVRNSAGEWVDAPPVDDTFVVNIGELHAIWTNDLYSSTLHRVSNFSGRSRVSAAFFVFPQGATEISCLETCKAPDNPPRYATTTSMKHVKALVEQSFRTGRPGLSAQTKERFHSS